MEKIGHFGIKALPHHLYHGVIKMVPIFLTMPIPPLKNKLTVIQVLRALYELNDFPTESKICSIFAPIDIAGFPRCWEVQFPKYQFFPSLFLLKGYLCSNSLDYWILEVSSLAWMRPLIFLSILWQFQRCHGAPGWFMPKVVLCGESFVSTLSIDFAPSLSEIFICIYIVNC